MRKVILFLVIVFLFILGTGLSTFPEVSRRGYAFPGTESGGPMIPFALYLLILVNLILFIGVLFSIVAHHYLRIMIGLFITFRVAEVVYEYTIDRHSLWYMVLMVLIYVLVGGGAILLLTRAEKNKEALS